MTLFHSSPNDASSATTAVANAIYQITLIASLYARSAFPPAIRGDQVRQARPRAAARELRGVDARRDVCEVPQQPVLKERLRDGDEHGAAEEDAEIKQRGANGDFVFFRTVWIAMEGCWRLMPRPTPVIIYNPGC